MLIMNGYIIALDQGTTSSRSIIFDSKGNIVSLAQYPFTQIYPKPGWVEHDPMVILESQMLAMSEAFEKSGLSPTDIAGIGITNQRETTIVWDKNTGKPIYNAIVWQCRRTAPICDQLTADGLGPYVKEKTGLLIDAYFSGTKIKCARARRARRAAVRQCGLVAHLESDRRPRPCVGLLQLLAHDAV